MSRSVVVIIPYFQRQAGLLQRAVRSVVAQDYAGKVSVIVVDDHSPLPASTELAELQAEFGCDRIRIIAQENAGPGAARNTGLQNVPADTDFVAYLDSDDEWFPHHLRIAIDALDLGYDFFYANIFDIGQKVDFFTHRCLPNSAIHSPVPGQPSLFAVTGDFFEEILTRCPIQTSTAVFRYRALCKLRFRTDLRNAFEDVVYWLQAAKEGIRAVFSTQVACQYGEGVNVFRGAAWGTDQNLRVVVDSVFFRSVARREFDLNASQRAFLSQALPDLRLAFVRITLSRLRRGKSVPWKEIKRQLSSDVLSALLFIPLSVRVAIDHLLARTPGE